MYLPTANGQFPERCTHRDFKDDPPCDESLGKILRKKKVPTRVYEHQSIVEWWGRMMSRPGVEASAERYVRGSGRRKCATDVWQAKRLRDFRFADDRTCFDPPPPQDTTGHFLFTFSIDWFKAHDSRAGKKAVSVGAIYLVCLNLPPEERFLRRNMCLVGIIPGPGKPTDDQLNHFLDKIVDDLEILWNGVYYSRTYEHREGRLVYGALGPVPCDLDAGRAVGGCTSHSHTLCCSFCFIHKNNLQNLDHKNWQERKAEDHRQSAEQWKAATNAKDRKALKDHNGVYWTPLVRLTYWDPVYDLVIDTMHNLYIGVAAHHCRDVWMMDASVSGGEGLGWLLPKHSVPSRIDMALGRLALYPAAGAYERLVHPTITKNVLRGLCIELGLTNGLSEKSTKEDMIGMVLHWVSSPPCIDQR